MHHGAPDTDSRAREDAERGSSRPHGIEAGTESCMNADMPADTVSHMHDFGHTGFFRLDLYGFSFLLTWIFLFLYSAVPGTFDLTSEALTTQVYLWSVTGLIITLVACTWRSAFFVSHSNSRTIRLSAPLAMSVGSAVCCLFAGSGLDAALMVAVFGLLTGFGSAIIVLRWVLVFEQTGPRVMLMNLPLFLAITVALCFTSCYLAPAVVIAIIVVLPCLSGLCLEYAQSHMDAETLLELDNLDGGRRPLGHGAKRSIALFLVCILIIGISAGYLDATGYSDSHYVYGSSYNLVNFLLLFVLVLVMEWRLHLSGNDAVTSVMPPAALIAAVMIPYATNYGGGALDGFYSAGAVAYEVLFFAVTILVADEYRVSAVCVYAIARIINALTNSAGDLLFRNLGVTLPADMSAQIVTIAIIVIVVVEAALLYLVLACLRSTELFEDALRAHPKEADVPETHADRPLQPAAAAAVKPRFRDSIHRAELRYGLSRRESDVFELLAQRMTSKQIQEELNISANTVAFHSKNIYVKLDVHSKQELVELVELERA